MSRAVAPLIVGLTCSLWAVGCGSDVPLGAGDAATETADLGLVDGSVDAGAPTDSGPLTPDAASPVDAGAELPIQTGLEIDINGGRLRGQASGDLRIFKGIPFAEPPIGRRRFAAPVPVEPWTGTFEADEFGPSCPQQNLGPEFLLGDFAGPTSEDCLSLNVWTHDDDRLRPVMVFIYGGGFIAGGSAWPIYEASRLARRADAVVVTINYRLGLLGFLATEALAAENGDDSAGNYGIMDQIEALRWVQRNIRAFGGDAANVTIFGESAGAISVCALLGAPSADKLFHKAIMESGMCTLGTERGVGILGSGSSMSGGALAVEQLGCHEAFDELDCLRSLPADELVASSSLMSIFTGDVDAITATAPHVDGVLIPEQPLARLARGEADRPFIAGSNENEGILFAASETVLSWRGLEDAIQSFTGLDDERSTEVADLYPFGQFITPTEAWIAFLGDITFICPGVSAAAAASGGAPSYAYHFTRSPVLARAVGAAHGIEMFYVFGTFGEVGLPSNRADERVVETMQRAWGTFAHYGAPDLNVTWPAFDPAKPSFAILDDPAEVVSTLRSGRCDKLKQVGLVP